MNKFKTVVKPCASCGETHLSVEFVALVEPREDATHSGICPVTGEEIFMVLILGME